LDTNHPQVCFIRETLEKETRLSYYERIKSIIPTEFHNLIPATSPGPGFEFKDENHPLRSKAVTLIEALRTKKSVEDVRELLVSFRKELAEEAGAGAGEDAQYQQQSRQLFVQCLLLVGSKSFSHILNVVERYLDVLRLVNQTPEGRLHTVQIVASFWKNNTQVSFRVRVSV
jgi:nuclear cap-binding protein subunit 1